MAVRPSQSRLTTPCAPIAAGRQWLVILLLAACYVVSTTRLSAAPEPASPGASSTPPPQDALSRHWAYQPLQAPDVPQVKGASWVRNPIDAFVLAELEARRMKP